MAVLPALTTHPVGCVLPRGGYSDTVERQPDPGRQALRDFSADAMPLPLPTCPGSNAVYFTVTTRPPTTRTRAYQVCAAG